MVSILQNGKPMNIKYWFTRFRILLWAHIFNWLWRGRERRRAVRGDVIGRIVPQYLKQYLYATKNVPDEVIEQGHDKIFTIWLQGEDGAPDLVKSCFRSVRRNCKQELVILDEKTLFEYITLPDYIMEKRRRGLIKNAHFADICRVELLYRYGGIWLDATAFMTAPIPKEILNQDCFVYMAGNVWGYSFIQNCFIRARRGSYLLAAWRAMIFEYWKNNNHAMDYLVHQLLFKTLVTNDTRAKKYFKKMMHINQEPLHVLRWEIWNQKFNRRTFDALSENAFFQKLTYFDNKKVIPDSFADVVINKKDV